MMDKDDLAKWQDRMLYVLSPEDAYEIVHYLILHNPWLEDWTGPDGRFSDVYDEIAEKAGL
jgi:hypothetical protein